MDEMMAEAGSSASEPTVSREVAEAEFSRFIEEMDIDLDESKLDDEDKVAVKKARDLLIKRMMQGHLTIDEKGQPVYRPLTVQQTLVFREPDGEVKQAMDQGKQGHNVRKMQGTIAQWTGVNFSVIRKMKERDAKVCESIFVLFFG